MKQKTSKITIKRNELLILLVLAVFTLCISTLSKFRRSSLKQSDCYTIGVITKKTHSKGSDMEYIYRIKGINYRSTGYSLDKKKRKIGGRFFVVFDKSRPKSSELFVQLPVPDSIQKAPYGGWDKIPIPEYQEYVDNHLDKLTNNWFMKLIPPW